MFGCATTFLAAVVLSGCAQAPDQNKGLPSRAIVAFEGECPRNWFHRDDIAGRFLPGAVVDANGIPNYENRFGGNHSVKLKKENIPEFETSVKYHATKQGGAPARFGLHGPQQMSSEKESDKAISMGAKNNTPVNIINPHIKVNFCQRR